MKKSPLLFHAQYLTSILSKFLGQPLNYKPKTSLIVIAAISVCFLLAPASQAQVQLGIFTAYGPVAFVRTGTPTPHLTITSPANKFLTTEASISVVGNVNDIVVGTVNDQQAQVTVGGLAAQGANRTFLATNVPLQMEQNIIQAVARDRVGNAATTQIVVTREEVTRAQIRLVSGNNQSAIIGTTSPAPLVVALTDENGKSSFQQAGKSSKSHKTMEWSALGTTLPLDVHGRKILTNSAGLSAISTPDHIRAPLVERNTRTPWAKTFPRRFRAGDAS